MNSKLFFSGQESAMMQWFDEQRFTQIFLLADARTHGFCIPDLLQLIPFLRLANRIVIPHGEQSKSLDSCELIWKTLTHHQADNDSLLINIGGGTISDIGGFAASLFKRGMSYLNIPTTLLAQADACYGGKTGINYQHIKNHLGTFQYPAAIYIHHGFLKTLEPRIIRSGWAEIIKHALISSPLWWSELRQYQPHDFELPAVIKQSLTSKHDFVEGDMNDDGKRQMLNFGHSIGHALESYSLLSAEPLYHGEAILLGMYWEARLSEQIFGLTAAVSTQLKSWIERYFPHCQIPIHYEACMHFLQQDKKNKQGLRMSLLRQIGQGEIQVPVTESQLSSLFNT